MADSFSFRVFSRTHESGFRTVHVRPEGVECDCPGFAIAGLCRHIDAVLLEGERAMVPVEDRALADGAAKLVAHLIVVPPEWKATWRRDYAWRGLTRTRPPVNPRTEGKPLVCFTGKFPGKDRKGWLAEAEQHGWATTDEPSRFTDVLVVGQLPKDSRKVMAARKHGTVIVMAEEWAEIMLDGVLPPRP